MGKVAHPIDNGELGLWNQPTDYFELLPPTFRSMALTITKKGAEAEGQFGMSVYMKRVTYGRQISTIPELIA
jgi:hypothetical protein